MNTKSIRIMEQNRLFRLALCLGLCLGLALAASMAFASVSHAASFTVTKQADTNDGACDADCSLREAVIAANAAAGEDTITIPAGTYTLTLTGAGEDASATGDLDVTGSTNFVGVGAGQTIIDGNAADRVFDFFPSSNITVNISGVTIRNGAATSAAGIFMSSRVTMTITESTISGNKVGTGGGGGIDNRGNLTITDSVISSNTSDGVGAGIDQSGGSLTITGSTFSNNNALASGGAIYNQNGQVSITRSTLSSNSAEFGGAIRNFTIKGKSLTITESTISNNRAFDTPGGEAGVFGDGGGIFARTEGDVNIFRSTLSGNTAARNGGGIFFQDNFDSSFADEVGALAITNSTLSGNTADGNGGALAVAPGLNNPNSNEGAATLNFSTITRNTAGSGSGVAQTGGTVNVKNTILAGRSGGTSDCSGTVVSQGNNLLGGGCPTGGSNDATVSNISNINNVLDTTLADNGGSTLTHKLVAGSPAVNAGNNSGAPSVDQRNVSRPQPTGGTVDIGSFELEANKPPVNTVPDAQSTDEDTPLVFGSANRVSISDPDAGNNPVRVRLQITNGTLTLSRTIDLTITGGANATNDMTFTGTIPNINSALDGLKYDPTPDYNGPATFTITTNDQGNTGSGGALEDTDTVDITVNAVNDAPILTLPGGSLSYTEGDTPPPVIDPGATVSDVDSPDFDTGKLTVDFTANGTADDRLAIRSEGIDPGEIEVSGTSVAFGGTVIGTFAGGSGTTPLVITFNASATPAAAQALARNITFANVSGNPSEAPRTVRFVITDGDGGTSDPATKTINVTAVNTDPTATFTAPATANEGSPFDISLTNVVDPDASDTHTYRFKCGGAAFSDFGSASTAECTAPDDGAFVVKGQVKDSSGGESPEYEKTVAVANVEPSVAAPDNQSADEGEDKSFDLGTFTDPGTDGPWTVTVDWDDGSADTTFTVEESARRTDGSFDLGQRNHTYDDDRAMPYEVTVTVAETGTGTPPSDSDTFDVKVENVAPDVSAPANQSSNKNEDESFDLGSFTDPGPDGPWAVAVDWGDNTANTTFTAPSPGSLGQGNHTYAASGAYTVTVAVSEADGDPAPSGSATFDVVVAPVNAAPTAGGGELEIAEDSGPVEINFGDFASDAETSAENLTYTITRGPAPSEGTLTGTGPKFTFEPAENFFGEVEIRYTVTDRGDPDGCESANPPAQGCADPETSDDEGIVKITVTSVNDKPTISGIPNRTINENASTGRVAFTIGDVETNPDKLTLARTSSNKTLVPDANIVFGGSGEGRTVEVTPARGRSGNAVITITVADEDGGTARTSFTLTVRAAPKPPPPNPNRCTIVGTPGNDRLVGTPGRDVICGLGGDDVIFGLGGNDVIRGGAGNDVIHGGAGNDTLLGGPGNDILIGGPGRDRLNGGPGRNILRQ